jgi:hypothetical protein
MAAVDWSLVPQQARMALLRQDWQRSTELQQANRRRIEGNRTLTYADYILTVKNSPAKAASIFAQYRDQRQALEDNHLIPDSGKLIEGGRLRQQAHDQVQQLAEAVAVASDLARKKLAHDRDQQRPKVDPPIHERKARQLSYLLDHGVSLDTLVRDNISDPVSLRVLQEEAPIFARGQAPMDRKAGEDFDTLMEQAAYNTYSDAYRDKADDLAAFDKGAYRATVALSATIRALRQDDRSELSVPAFAEGQLIEA